MKPHDPTYGGLLLPQADVDLMEDALAAGERFAKRAAFRAEEAAVHAESLRVTRHYHPEVLPAAAWRSMRITLIVLLQHHAETLKQLDAAEQAVIAERLARCEDRGLIGGPTR